MLPTALRFDIATAVVCGTLILTRCAYRVFFRCTVHPTCHRRWRIDDVYMALAILPLTLRTATIVTSFVLNPTQSSRPVAEDEVAASDGMSWEEMTADRVLARKLLLPGRIGYALL